jgi:hypothetical protein
MEDLLRGQENGSLFLEELTLTGGGVLLFKPCLTSDWVSAFRRPSPGKRPAMRRR